MREMILNANESGQRLDKYLKKLLPKAPASFLYKMLRKKNITLNHKKADGREILSERDSICLFISEETFRKFSEEGNVLEREFSMLESLSVSDLTIVYEDGDLLVINKPAGLLSQMAESGDISANEKILAYLIQTKQVQMSDLRTFRPSVCNRLDRNTSGLLIAGKTLKGLQRMSELLRTREVKKLYRCVVCGKLEEEAYRKGYLIKNPDTNQVTISGRELPGSRYIETAYRPIHTNGFLTLLEVHLMTGRTHQIRAHLASDGYPIVGDPKYGDPMLNRRVLQHCGIDHQLLHAFRLELPDGRILCALEPDSFRTVMDFRQFTA